MTKPGDETKAAAITSDMAHVLNRVQSAIHTLRRVPSKDRPSRVTAWPDIVRDFWDCYGYHDPTPPRLVPTAKQISEMDEVLGWMAWLAHQHGPATMRIVWAVAAGGSFRKVARLTGIKSHHTVRAYYVKGLCGIATRFVKK